MSAVAAMTIVNWGAFAKGLQDAQKKKIAFMRGEMKRGANRINKKFIREQLQGPPGIKAGKLAKGKNVRSYVKSRGSEVTGEVSISRILHVHEKGLTIPGRRRADRLLFLRKNKKIFAVVPQVVIPSRLRYRELVARESPKTLVKVAEAGARGIEVSLKNSLARAI